MTPFGPRSTQRNHPGRAAPSDLEMTVHTLYQHADGRYAVSPGTDSPAFTHGDPGWARLGPVDVSAVGMPQQLTDERIDAIAELVIKGMPEGIRGFVRLWGWRCFARELLDVCAGHVRAPTVVQDAADAARYRAFFDTGLPVTFCGVDCRSKAEADRLIDEALALRESAGGEAEHG